MTLVELVLSIAIIGVLIGVIGPVLRTGLKSYALVATRRVMLGQVRVAMERMTTEIMEIKNAPSIDIWTSGALQFDTASENDINYTLNGSNLERNGAVLADGVSSLTFTYLDQNGVTASSKNDIMRIGIEFEISAGTGYGTLKVKSQVFPRQFSNAYAGFDR